MTRLVRVLIVLLCLSMILFSSLMLLITQKGYWKSDASYQQLSQYAQLPMPQPGDRILTLSTCTYEFDDARYVVLGILEKEE